MASAAFGPITLFNSLASRTLSSNGYEFKPYMEVKKDSIILGVFNDYVVQDGVYSHHLYSGDSTQEGCVEVTSLKLFIICGNTEFIGPVSYSQPCKYQALLQTPAACGVDFSVGDELLAPTPSGNSTTGVIIASSVSSTVALALGALGISGAMVVIIMQIVKAVRTKGGLRMLLKGKMGKVNGVLNNAMENVPLSDEMKKKITSMIDKQADSLVVKLDNALDEKLQGVRTETGEGNDLEAAKKLVELFTKKAIAEHPKIVVAVELPSVPQAEEIENKN